MPADMLFVQVRPQKYKGHSPGKPLFKVDVHKLKLGLDWLKQHNPCGAVRVSSSARTWSGARTQPPHGKQCVFPAVDAEGAK